LPGFGLVPNGKTPVSASAASLLRDQADLEVALAALASSDPDFVRSVMGDRPAPALRRRDPGFAGLTWIVVGQQVSVASATAINGRLVARLGQIDAHRLHATSDDDLKLCGLSTPKLRTLRAMTAAVLDGTLDLAALATMDADAAHAALTAIKGIGPWTADIFLLFCLGHADAWPAGDLALQEAARVALALPARPTTRDLHVIGERWRPHRGVAAHCLWAYYHHIKAASAPRQTKRKT
jgi:DNA-3-methyladenine glycosylase II